MIPRRRKDLLFEVLGSKKGIAAPAARAGDPAAREAVVGALAAVALLIAVALGGYYLASRRDEPLDAPALSAERGGAADDGAEAAPPAAARADGSAPASRKEPPAFAVCVRTIKLDDDPAKAKAALEETKRLTTWLSEMGLPEPRAILTKTGSAYAVYVGGSDSFDGLKKLLERVRDLTYARKRNYFDGAYITSKPLG